MSEACLILFEIERRTRIEPRKQKLDRPTNYNKLNKRKCWSEMLGADDNMKSANRKGLPMKGQSIYTHSLCKCKSEIFIHPNLLLIV